MVAQSSTVIYIALNATMDSSYPKPTLASEYTVTSIVNKNASNVFQVTPTSPHINNVFHQTAKYTCQITKAVIPVFLDIINKMELV
jgi:hypothetical protein